MRCRLLITVLLVVSACVSRETTGVLPPALVSARADGAVVDTTQAALEAYGISTLGPAEREAFEQASSLDRIQFLMDRKELEIARLQARQSRLFVLIFFLLAVIATLFWYLRARKLLADKQLAEEKAETERLLSVAEELQSRLASRDGHRPERDMLERLCEQYYIYEGTENLKPKILGEVGSLIDTLRRDPFYLLDDDTAARIKALPIKDEDIRLAAYLAAGLSATTLSTLMERDKQVIYNRVHRLKDRLATLPDGASILSLIRGK